MARARTDVLPAGLLAHCEAALLAHPQLSRREPAVVSPLPGLRILGHPIRTEFESFPLSRANEVLLKLKRSELKGSGVLLVED